MIVLDIDGVVSNSEPWLVKEIEERIGRPLKYEHPRRFQFDMDLTDEELGEYIKDALIKYKDNIHPHDYTRTMMALLLIEYEYGTVNFVTARPNGKVHDATVYWLDKHFPLLNYRLHSLGEFANKADWMYDNEATAIVEDRFKTANEVASPHTTTYLVDRIWNRGRVSSEHVKRVVDLHSAIEHYFNVIYYSNIYDS